MMTDCLLIAFYGGATTPPRFVLQSRIELFMTRGLRGVLLAGTRRFVGPRV